jgi:acyl dehydratase
MRPDLIKVTDPAQMMAWGELSGDRNPLHVDPNYAVHTRYGGTIAHGHMVVAWIVEWLAARGPAADLSNMTLGALQFRAPVRPGHRYVIRATECGVEMVDEQSNPVLTAEVRKGTMGDGHGKGA